MRRRLFVIIVSLLALITLSLPAQAMGPISIRPGCGHLSKTWYVSDGSIPWRIFYVTFAVSACYDSSGYLYWADYADLMKLTGTGVVEGYNHGNTGLNGGISADHDQFIRTGTATGTAQLCVSFGPIWIPACSYTDNFRLTTRIYAPVATPNHWLLIKFYAVCYYNSGAPCALVFHDKP